MARSLSFPIRLTLRSDDKGIYFVRGRKKYRPDFDFGKDTPAHRDTREMRSRWGVTESQDERFANEIMPKLIAGHKYKCSDEQNGLCVQILFPDDTFTCANFSDESLPDMQET